MKIHPGDALREDACLQRMLLQCGRPAPCANKGKPEGNFENGPSPLALDRKRNFQVAFP